MILPPFAAPEGFTNSLHPAEEREASWFLFSGDQLLLCDEKKSLPTEHSFSLDRSIFLGMLGEQSLYAGEVEKGAGAPKGWGWCSMRELHGILGEEEFAIAGRAYQLIHWDRTNQYCGGCGAATFHREKERCRECSSCKQLSYPKMAPAIMALLKKEDQILLARGPHFPENFFSVLAGYVDPGETLEQCVAREVAEEVGIQVENIQYFGSQPWPFSQSLMVGFICDWAAGEIEIDPVEIESAAWFESSDLPQLPPNLSLSRMMIDSVLYS